MSEENLVFQLAPGVTLDATCYTMEAAVRKAFEHGQRHRLPAPSPAPEELSDFLDRIRLMGVKGYKGDFVARDGTRIPLEVLFERQEKPEPKRRRAVVDDE